MICNGCGSTKFVKKEKPFSNGSGMHLGVYCEKCGRWQKWEKQAKQAKPQNTSQISKWENMTNDEYD